jgi:hypothetical protein
MENESKKYNLIALSEVYVESIKDKLDEVSEVIVRLVHKENTVADTAIITSADKLGETLIEVFEKPLTGISSVEISYVHQGVEKKMNGITIV